MIYHNIDPVFNENSKIMILGSFPSVKSREGEFFYDHPKNRFWKVLSAVTEDVTPITHEEKREFLLKHNIALWDVISSCEIIGSSDSSIKNAKANDLSVILNNAEIERIFCNGAASFKYYNKYTLKNTLIEAIKLPSTSPANASFSLEKLIEEWKIIGNYL